MSLLLLLKPRPTTGLNTGRADIDVQALATQPRLLEVSALERAASATTFDTVNTGLVQIDVDALATATTEPVPIGVEAQATDPVMGAVHVDTGLASIDVEAQQTNVPINTGLVEIDVEALATDAVGLDQFATALADLDVEALATDPVVIIRVLEIEIVALPPDPIMGTASFETGLVSVGVEARRSHPRISGERDIRLQLGPPRSR